MHNNSERTFRRCWPIIDFIFCTSATNTWSARVCLYMSIRVRVWMHMIS